MPIKYLPLDLEVNPRDQHIPNRMILTAAISTVEATFPVQAVRNDRLDVHDIGPNPPQSLYHNSPDDLTTWTSHQCLLSEVRRETHTIDSPVRHSKPHCLEHLDDLGVAEQLG